MRLWAAAAMAVVCAACTSRPSQQVTAPHVTVYFCRAGTDTLVPMPFSVDARLQGERLESALVGQLLAGPAVAQASVVLFPPQTRAAVTLTGSTATVDFSGALAKPYRGGASDEVALFKSLTYTLTSVSGVSSVQVLVEGRKVSTLPGGEFELDEPLTRETFSQ